MHPIELPIEKLLEACEIRRGRRSGPGGQHRNKVETAIVITHLPTGVVGQASEKRSQHKNHQQAVQRLRLNLALAVRTDRQVPDESPSELWKTRRRGTKLSVSSEHQDFARLLAEALDILLGQSYDLASAATILGISSSQLIKLLKQIPAAFTWLNLGRTENGLGKLK